MRSAEVFRDAVRRGRTVTVVVHSQPSGDATPSDDDVVVTRPFVAAGKLFDIEVVDYLVIGQQRLTALSDCGLAFKPQGKACLAPASHLKPSLQEVRLRLVARSMHTMGE